MNNWNDYKIYEHSLYNDPALATTARNFEFKVLRPELLERAIQKVNTDKKVTKKLSSFSKPHPKRAEKHIPQKSTDMDVETQLSRERVKKVRALTDIEVEELILKAQSENDNLRENVSVEEICNDYYQSTSKKQETAVEAENIGEKQIDWLTKSVENSLHAVNNLLMNKNHVLPIQTKIDKKVVMPRPHWVEILENPEPEMCTISEIRKPFLYKTPLSHVHNRLSSAISSAESIPSSEFNVYSSAPVNRSMAKGDLGNDFRLGKALDRLNNLKEDNYFDLPSSVDDPKHQQRFIEMETKVPRMNLSFLKNSSPMRYTELTEDLETESNMKVLIRSKLENEADNATKSNNDKTQNKPPQAIVPMKSPKLWQSPNTPRPKGQRISTTPRTPSILSARFSTKSQSINTARTQTTNTTNSARQRPLKPMARALAGRHSSRKSIEELKIEKLEIFKKMSSTQERIIEILDKLRMALLEVYIPNSNYDKTKRQKNALEFSVRFSRNFLYPLKGMIDDLHLTNVDVLNSTTSNEATMRVASIYNLLLQSLTTYHKQLRFFLLDQVPQKLSNVLEMINATTKTCLEKEFFDRNDSVVECLLERSSKFTEFLNDLNEKHGKQQISPHATQSRSALNPKTSNHYELKMCMNDLNMYEPKLVPRRKPLKKEKQQSEKQYQQQQGRYQSHMFTKGSSDGLARLQIENVSTEIMQNNMSDEMSAQDSAMMQQNHDEEEDFRKHEIAAKLTDALKKATKSQVCQALEPILQHLGIFITDQVGNKLHR